MNIENDVDFDAEFDAKMRKLFIQSLRTLGIDDTVVWNTEKNMPIGELHSNYFMLFRTGWVLSNINDCGFGVG